MASQVTRPDRRQSPLTKQRLGIWSPPKLSLSIDIQRPFQPHISKTSGCHVLGTLWETQLERWGEGWQERRWHVQSNSSPMPMWPDPIFTPPQLLILLSRNLDMRQVNFSTWSPSSERYLPPTPDHPQMTLPPPGSLKEKSSFFSRSLFLLRGLQLLWTQAGREGRFGGERAPYWLLPCHLLTFQHRPLPSLSFHHCLGPSPRARWLSTTSPVFSTTNLCLCPTLKTPPWSRPSQCLRHLPKLDRKHPSFLPSPTFHSRVLLPRQGSQLGHFTIPPVSIILLWSSFQSSLT